VGTDRYQALLRIDPSPAKCMQNQISGRQKGDFHSKSLAFIANMAILCICLRLNYNSCFCPNIISQSWKLVKSFNGYIFQEW